MQQPTANMNTPQQLLKFFVYHRTTDGRLTNNRIYARDIEDAWQIARDNRLSDVMLVTSELPVSPDQQRGLF